MASTSAATRPRASTSVSWVLPTGAVVRICHPRPGVERILRGSERLLESAADSTVPSARLASDRD